MPSSSVPVIVGYGSVTALGTSSQEALRAMRDRTVNCLCLESRFFPPDVSCPCFAVDGLADRLRQCGADSLLAGRRENRTVLLAVAAICEALERASLSLSELRRKRVGVVLGTTVGCTFHNEDYYLEWRNGEDPAPEPLFTYLSANLAARVQAVLGCDGPGLVITNACASGTDAIGVAKTWLQTDRCDIAIAGGADELSRVACHGFHSLRLYSSEPCKPFARGRQGLNLGEGAGVLIMEPGAVERERKIYGRVLGYGASGDGYHPTAPHPQGMGLQRAVARALTESGIGVNDISLINAHGTGTPANDRAETAAIAALGFSESQSVVISTKGMTGHTLGAAGGVEAVFTLMSLNEGRTVGSVGCLCPDSDLAFSVLPEAEERLLAGKVGLSQSLAFGGSNSALVLEGAML